MELGDASRQCDLLELWCPARAWLTPDFGYSWISEQGSGLKKDAYESETLETKCDVCHYEKNFAARGAVTTNASLRRDLAELLRKQVASDADIDEYWKELREKDKGRA